MDGANLVGRDGELAELRSLAGPGRLVTLTGPGGVGKTTLAQAFVAHASTRSRVVFVDLAGVELPSAVESTFAASMGLASFDLITAGIVPDGTLVVVDNCEHVLDAAATAITQLQAVLSGVSLLATSRAPLGLRHEIVVRIGPLAVPPHRLADVDAAAVVMFRSVADRAGGRIDDADLGDVCELVRRIDGVPLAIEITATRTRSMSVAEILERLGDRLDTIGQGGFRRDARQRSVRDTVEWSYRLLDRPQRQLFDRLGVHAGRFSGSMAHAVAGDGTADETLDQLDALVTASLVVPTRGLDGSTWYHQLHAVRACALDHLEASGELTPTTERFVDHLVSATRQLATHTERGWTAETFAIISGLLDGLLHALHWTTGHDDSPERTFELLTVLWGHQSRTDEVLGIGGQALERWPDTGLPRWADAAATVATCLWIRRDLDVADALVERALAVADGGIFAPILLRRIRGQIRREQGRHDEAIEWLGQAAEEARRFGYRALVVDAELLRAALLSALDDSEGALRITGQVRALGSEGPIAEVLALTIESDALLRTDPASAVELAQYGFELASQTLYSAAAVGFCRTAAIGHAVQGDFGAATTALSEAIEVMVQSGSMAPSGAVLEAAAVLAHRAGRGEWATLAQASTASPAVQLVTSARRLLPDWSAESIEVLELADALALTDRVVAEVANDAADAADATDRRPSDSPAAAPAIVAADRANSWVRHGDHWQIEFDGRSVTVRHTKGMDDLGRLIEAVDTELAAVDLIGASITSGDTGAVLDANARRQYEDRIRELQAELAEADDDNDIGRAERLTVELDTLVEHLTKAVGLGGKTRRTGTTAERARTAVTRRIRKAIAHLLDLHPPLGRHLDASIRTGTYCAYRPERPIGWRVSR